MDLFLTFLGLAILVAGAELMVRGAVDLALRAHVSPLVIGLTVVSMGTSAPELLVSLVAAFKGTPDIAIGNVVGSNIANISMILGLSILVFPIEVDREARRVHWPLMMAVTLLFWWFFQNDLISRVEQRLAANVGAASARALVSGVVTNETISVEELKRLAGETEQIRAYSAELEKKSQQIEAALAELERANRRLREIDSQKDEFLSQVSHEVRTPMTSIRSFSDILLRNRDIEEAQRLRFLGIIQNESMRLTRLLDGILDLNQMESGTPSWEETTFDPETVLTQAMQSCEALAHGAGVTLKRSRRARKVLVNGDRDRLAQVFINLISNAIKYNTSAEPTVIISSTVRKGTYEARIGDNGPGIPEAERERIFMKFARGSMPRQGGVGLGLAISRQIVERFGGNLFLTDSKAGGAEFIVRLKKVNESELLQQSIAS